VFRIFDVQEANSNYEEDPNMKAKHLIIYSALLLPAGLAHAQYGAPQAGSPSPTPDATSQAAPAAPTTPAAPVEATPASDADLAKGKVVNDPAGQPVGTIDSISDAGVVLAVGEQRIQVPKKVIGKTDSGLVIAVTRAQLEAASKKRSPS
jgi:hypothetical protein